MAGPPGCASGTARPLEPLALAAGLVAGRDDLGAGRNALCDGSERYADHRQSRRDGAHAGEHAQTPRITDFSLNITSRRKPDAIADGRPVSAIFPDVSIRSHRCSGPRGIPLPAPCRGRERRQNPPFGQARWWPIGTFKRVDADSGEHRRCSRVAVSGFERRGPRLVGKSDEYRRYARECLEMASAISDPRARASLLQMAQVWFRLADRMPADAKDESHQVEG